MSIKLIGRVLVIILLFHSSVSLGKQFDGEKVRMDKKIQKALATCDVSWDSLGYYSAHSMPLGNGDIALNVWTEQNGDVLFYISKTDAWNESGNLVKIGRVRVSLNPNPFFNGALFQQVLLLKDSEIQISGGTEKQKTILTIWVDANNPVIRLQVASQKPVKLKVTLDPWRTEVENASGGLVSADVVSAPSNNQIVWYHRNEKTKNPNLVNRTFGAMIEGDGLINGEGNSLQTVSPGRDLRFSVSPLTAVTPTADDWLQQLNRQVAGIKSLNWEKSNSAHKQWWQQFWQRSWIFINGDDAATSVTRGYVLQRFKTACAGRGAYAIKFNGSLFTMDNPAEGKGKDKITGKAIIEPVNADFRAWGGQYWFQNTRPMYWPRLAAGDFDLMKPLFRMFQNMLPANSAQVREYYGHNGTYFNETAPFWGGLPNIKAGSKGSYTYRYFTPILELSAMMIDYYVYTGDKQFVRETLLPVASAGLTFFEEHFPRDESGKLLLFPDNSIEMYWDVRNPLPDIAGLHYVLGRLLELPDDLIDAKTRSGWQNLQKILPEIPVGTKNGKRVLLPYADANGSTSHNTENPELYAIHPFRIYGLGKPDFQLALETFNERLIKRTGCWHQDVVDAPMLGLTELAKKDVTSNLTLKDKRLRFPAFWDRGHDYMPDEDNGGNGELGLQKMLIQCDGKRILLLPAWPKEWTASFKLNAPYNTIVEGQVENGKIVRMRVIPESRSKDIVIHGKSE
jgi:alpha-L-fucosidase 2